MKLDMKNDLLFKYALVILITIACINSKLWANNNSNADKTKTEIDTLIQNIGTTTPDWWNSVELRIPEHLDMDWPVRTSYQQGFGGGRGGRNQFGGRGGQGGGFGFRGGRQTYGFQAVTPASQDNSKSIESYLVQVIYPNESRYKTGESSYDFAQRRYAETCAFAHKAWRHVL